jgi:hypothetical protein
LQTEFFGLGGQKTEQQQMIDSLQDIAGTNRQMAEREQGRVSDGVNAGTDRAFANGQVDGRTGMRPADRWTGGGRF